MVSKLTSYASRPRQRTIGWEQPAVASSTAPPLGTASGDAALDAQDGSVATGEENADEKDDAAHMIAAVYRNRHRLARAGPDCLR
ncbi:hypothetical protein [Trinickia acidisoli]|uniref:hypothetical protein n=1 Tax=Trinickia acidisoli TaxID=2767482 RepID=UPI002852F30F|nr:hypothetical protein [Trinickia acidisoli]